MSHPPLRKSSPWERKGMGICVLTAPMAHVLGGSLPLQPAHLSLVFSFPCSLKEDGSNAEALTRIPYSLGVHCSCPLVSAPISVSRILRETNNNKHRNKQRYYKYLWELLCSVLKPFLLPSIILLDCLPSQAMAGHFANMAKMGKRT